MYQLMDILVSFQIEIQKQTVNEGNSIFSIKENGDVKITGNITEATTDNLDEGSSNFYHSESRVNTVLNSLNTDLIPSQDNTYDIGTPYTTMESNIWSIL